MKKVLWVIGGLFVILVIIGAASGSKPQPAASNNNQPDQNAQQQAQKKFDVKAFYDQVQNGQTKDQVTSLAGKNPDNCSESEIAGYGKTEVCNWNGSFGDNAFATISFKDNAVDSKSKTGF